MIGVEPSMRSDSDRSHDPEAGAPLDPFRRMTVDQVGVPLRTYDGGSPG